jgi:Ohr subfamily peroxiredoxin
MTITKIEKVLLTGKTHTTLHQGSSPSRGAHGNLDITLSAPGMAKAKQEYVDIVPHPTAEQFFAGAWSSCYTTALGIAAQEKGVTLPADLAVDIEVDLGQTGEDYFLQARFNISMPGVPHDVVEAIAHRAHTLCPYSKATKDTIAVALTIAAA